MRRFIIVSVGLLVFGPAANPAHADCAGATQHIFTQRHIQETEALTNARSFADRRRVEIENGASGRGEMLANIRSACKIGDIISIPANETFMITNLCDFNKAMPTSGGSLMCVIKKP